MWDKVGTIADRFRGRNAGARCTAHHTKNQHDTLNFPSSQIATLHLTISGTAPRTISKHKSSYYTSPHHKSKPPHPASQARRLGNSHDITSSSINLITASPLRIETSARRQMPELVWHGKGLGFDKYEQVSRNATKAYKSTMHWSSWGCSRRVNQQRNRPQVALRVRTSKSIQGAPSSVLAPSRSP